MHATATDQDHDARLRALGARTASVIHEISAPLSLVSGGIEALETEVEALQTEIEALAPLLHMPAAGDPNASHDAQTGARLVDGSELKHHLEQVGELLGILRAGAAQLTHVTDQVRAFALKGGRVEPLEPRGVDVVEALAEAIQLVRANRRGRVRREPRIKTNVGGAPRVNASRSGLISVLANLVGNAWDAAEESTDPRVWIDLGAEPREAADAAADADAATPLRFGPSTSCGRSIGLDGGLTPSTVSICIRDSGPGIAPGDRERIFDPFFTTKSRSTGLGLGLTITKEIVEGWGGTLVVGSLTGGGAELVVRLPRY